MPSYIAKTLKGYEVINFGETGYVAHQSLNLFLQRYYQGFRPEVVVSYDGVNEAWTKCRRELGPYSHSREYEIRTILKEGGADNPESFAFTILPIRNFAEKVGRVLAARKAADKASFFDCDENVAKAEQVARFLLSDWMLMKTLVESYGGLFISILQPHAYGSRTKVDHLKLNEALGRQYAAVYPKILKLLPEEFPELQSNFADFRHALDQDEYFYIDWCHLSPNGNEIVAAGISEIIQRGSVTNTALRSDPDGHR